jgi:hypothetical protein
MTGALNLDNEQELRLSEADGSGANYVAIKALTTLGANYTLTLPANDGDTGQYLQTDGNGVLAWVTPAGVGETNTASNQGAAGVGVFKQKTTFDLEFRNINAASNKISVALDAPNNEIDINVAEANLSLGAIPNTPAGTIAAITAQTAINELDTDKVAKNGDSMSGALTFATQNQARFADSAGGEYAAIQAPATIGTNYTLTLPDTAGSASQVLTTNGSGVLSWTTPSSTPGADSLDFTHFVDAMTLDANTSITSSGTNALSFINTGTGNSLLVEDVASDTSPFVIDASGNVGVGTTTPAEKLTVVDGMIRVDTTSFNGGSTIALGSKASGVSSAALLYTGWFSEVTLSGYHSSLSTTGGRINLYNDGDVSIGSTWTDAQSKLYVEGNAAVGAGYIAAAAPANGMIIQGNVGIGTTTPGTMLDAAGAITSRPFGTGTGQTGQIIMRELAAGGTDTVTLRAPDAVGTSYALTLPDTAGSASQVLTTNGSGVLSWTTVSTTPAADSLNFTEFADNMVLDVSTDISVTGTNVLSITNSGTGNSFRVNDDVADTSPFIINDSGRVGIGTTSPESELHIMGEPVLQATGSLDAKLHFKRSSGPYRYATVQYDAGSVGLDFRLDGATIGSVSSKMIIKDTGNVGIGTTSPGTILDVAGAITSRPSGTGTGQTGQLIMRELAAGGTETATIRAPDALGASYALTLPADDGANGQVLATDGSGVLSWIAAGVPAADSINFTELADALVLDASTDISATGANTLTITNDGTGHSLRVNDVAGDTTPFIIDTSGNVGIGTSAPNAALLHLHSTSSTTQKISTRHNTPTNSSQMLLQRARNNAGADSVIMSGDVLGLYGFQGYNSASYGTSASIGAVAAENFNGGALGTDLTFSTNAISVSSLSERMRITANGLVGIGTTVPGTILDAAGAITSRPFGTATGETGQLIMRELAAGGTDTVTLRAPDAVGTSYALTLPGTAGAANQVLTTDGAGVLSWTTPSGGGGALSGITAATATNTIANTNYAQAWNWDTLTTQTAMSMGTTSGTTGTLLNLANTFNSATSTGNVLKVSATGASNAAVPLMLTNAGTGNSLRVNDDGTDTDTTPFVINASGSVGIGTTSPAGILDVRGGTNPGAANGTHINIVGQAGGTGNRTGGDINLTAGAGSGTGSPGRVNITSTNSTASAVGTINGLAVDASNSGGALATTVVGLESVATSSNSGSSITTGTGVQGRVFSSQGTITTAYGGQFSSEVGSSLAVYGDVYGSQSFVDIGTAAATTAYGGEFHVLKSTGSIGTGYGVYIGNVQATVPYALFSSSTAPSSFGGNVGIGTTTPGTLLDVAGAITSRPFGTGTGQTGQLIMRELAAGGTDTVAIRAPDAIGTSYALTLPGTAGSASQVLTTNGSGVLSWTTPSAGGGALSSITAATATNTIANTNYAQAWNWDTLTTQTAMSMGTTSGTTGTLLNLTNSFNSATSTGNVLKVSAAGVSNAAVPLMLTNAGTGLSLRVNDDGTDTDTSPFVVTAAGNVGVGTTTPATALQVNGTATASNFEAPSEFSIRIAGGGNGLVFWNTWTNFLYDLDSNTTRGGRIRASTGTAAAPTYGFSGAAGLGLYAPAADTLRLSTASTDRMTIDSSGNVGIGTTTASERLTVVSNSAANGGVILVQNLNTAGYSETLAKDSAGTNRTSFGYGNSTVAATHFQSRAYQWLNTGVDYVMGTSAAGLFTVQNAGNVGIGTTAPGTLLDVAGAITSRPSGTGTGQTGQLIMRELAANGTNTATVRVPDALTANYILTLPVDDGISGQVLRTDGAGVLSWVTAPTSGGTFLAADGSVAAPSISFMNDTDTGFYGSTDSIGITIAGIDAGSLSNGAFVFYRIVRADNGSVTTPDFSFNLDDDTGIYNPAVNSLGFVTNATERMRINASGNVGIGTTAPSNNLHVRGSDAATNTTTNVLRLEHESSATPAANFGTGILFSGESSTTSNQDMAQISSLWTTATHASRSSALAFSTMRNGGSLTESARLDDYGNFGVGTTSIGVGNLSEQVWVRSGSGVGAFLAGSSAFMSGINNKALFGQNMAYSSFGSLKSVDLGATRWSGMEADSGALNFYTTTTAATSWGNISPTPSMAITTAGNVGIGTTVPGTILDAAGAITSRPSGTGTGQTGQLIMRELAAGGTETVTVRAPDAITTSYALTLPTTAGSASQVLTTNGSGVLSWTTPSGGAAALSGLTAAAATNTIANANFAQAWNWDTLTTQTAMSMGTTSGTTGTLLNLTNSFNSATSTGNVLKVAATGASNAAVPLMVTNAGTGNALRVNDDGTDTDATPFIVDASGNVGIGTTAPGRKLHVDGGANFYSGPVSFAHWQDGWSSFSMDNSNTGVNAAVSMDFGNSAGGIGALWVGSPSHGSVYSRSRLSMESNATNSTGLNLVANGASSDVRIMTGGTTERMRITSAGNVGIGTTAPGTPVEIMTASANSVVEALTLSNPQTSPSWAGTAIRFNGTSGQKMGGIVSQYDSASNNANLIFETRQSDSVRTSMFLTFGGSLYVSGDEFGFNYDSKINSMGSSTAGNAIINGLVLNHSDSDGAGASGIGTRLNFTAETTTADTFAQSGAIVSVLDDATNTSKDGSMRFLTLGPNATAGANDATEKMRIDSAGNVGIGSTAPSRKFDVVDSQAATTVARFENTSTAAGALGIEVETGPTANPTNTTDFIVFKDGDGTVIGQIEGGGGANVAYTTTSDRRLKENIRDTHYSIEQILQIQVRDYNYKQSAKQMTGFIAQELYKIYPHAVSRPQNEEKESWGVDYSQMTPILVKGLQDLHGICKMEQKQRDQILARIQAQEQVSVRHGRDIATLKKENEQMRLRAEKAEKENAEIKRRLERIEKLLLNK